MNWKLKKFDELTSRELYEILRLRNEVFIIEQECPYLDCDRKDYGAYHLFLEDDTGVIAYLRVLDKGVTFDEVCIGRVIVKETHRGKGLAQEMLRLGLKVAEEKYGETTVKISAQQRLVKLYESVGFKQVSDMYMEDNIPHVAMIREI